MSPLLISPSEYTITMYDTKSRELRWNATYSDYASTLPDDDTKYSKTIQHAGSFDQFILWQTVIITGPLFGSPQKWLILCPTVTAWWWRWTANQETFSGSRTITLRWWPCISGSARASAKFPTLTLPWKPCGTSLSCLERLAASHSGNTHFQKRISPRTNSCKQC